MSRHILAIDQGTTGSTALVMSTDGRTLGRFGREFTQHFPQPGWVERDPREIFLAQMDLRGARILAHVSFIARFRNGDDVGLSQNPGKRNLGCGRIVIFADFL